MYLIVKVLVAQSCQTLWDRMDCSPRGSSVNGILQARKLEWIAIPFSRGSSQPRDQTWVSCIAGRFFTVWATREAPYVAYISIIMLNVNWLNAPIKRYNGYKNKTLLYTVYKRPTSDLGTHRVKVRGWKKIFHASGNQKKAGVAIVISDKKDFKIKTVIRDKEGHYMMIQESIQEEDIKL